MSQTHFCYIYGPGNVSDGCKYRPISVKRNLKIESNVADSELYVTV